MRHLNLFLLAMLAVTMMAACSKNGNPGPEPGPEPEPEPQGTNLSKSGTSNCYVIMEEGDYYFNALVPGNGQNTEGLPPFTALEPVSAKLVWQTELEMITDLKLEDGNIFFTASSKAGNAVIAACDENDEIIWSWHIWHPEEEIKNLSGVMNMNVGALNSKAENVKSYGMLYQWGRKDPFPSAATLTGDTKTLSQKVFNSNGAEVLFGYTSWTSSENNTLEYSIANPMICIASTATANKDWLKESIPALWGNPKGSEKDAENKYSTKGNKSIYDPCPPGWRVADPGTFSYLTTSGGYAWTYDQFVNIVDYNKDGVIDQKDFAYGWTIAIDGDVTEMGTTHTFFPAAGRFYGQYGMLYGSVCGLWGNYWSNAPYLTGGVADSGFCALNFQFNTMSPAASADRADGFSVRCVKE